MHMPGIYTTQTPTTAASCHTARHTPVTHSLYTTGGTAHTLQAHITLNWQLHHGTWYSNCIQEVTRSSYNLSCPANAAQKIPKPCSIHAAINGPCPDQVRRDSKEQPLESLPLRKCVVKAAPAASCSQTSWPRSHPAHQQGPMHTKQSQHTPAC